MAVRKFIKELISNYNLDDILVIMYLDRNDVVEYDESDRFKRLNKENQNEVFGKMNCDSTSADSTRLVEAAIDYHVKLNNSKPTVN